MIIMHMLSGLGNQMFQYAFGRALSLTHGTELRLDLISYRQERTWHNGFELARLFDIAIREPDAHDLWKVHGWRTLGGAYSRLAGSRFSWLRGSALMIEPHHHFWPEALPSPENKYYIGYWQSEKYFAAHQETIRRDFAFKLPLSKENAALQRRMRSCEAVSLHVRRSDYLHPMNLHVLGVTPLEYYQKAIAWIAARCARPHFFVFSDDIPWARAHLPLQPFPCVFIEHNSGPESYNDMRLMSQCQHHIIANSTFSWWGAWLNPSQDKMVVAPDRWFVSDRFKTVDLTPAGWIKL
ncbi:MAG: alpha-1,2-fucosyltransferase [Magnetococcales bacterium]|nr:alpha-1,2-fucosyltransferase [Magnetococcales bacterium]